MFHGKAGRLKQSTRRRLTMIAASQRLLEIHGDRRRARLAAAAETGRSDLYIAMNRFRVVKDAADEFERIWLGREIHLHHMPGFIAFHLLRGPEREDHRLYSSHTLWASEQHFLDWTRSEAFRAAHGGAGGSRAARRRTLSPNAPAGLQGINPLGPAARP